MANYYVTQSGSGSGDGSSKANSMSIASVNAKNPVFQPGDNIYIVGYITSQITPNTCCATTATQFNPITFSSWSGQGVFNTGTSAAFYGTDIAGIKVKYLSFQGTPTADITTGDPALIYFNYTAQTGRKTGGISVTKCRFNGGFAGVCITAAGISGLVGYTLDSDLTKSDFANCGLNNITIEDNVISNPTSGANGIAVMEAGGTWSGYRHFSGVSLQRNIVNDILWNNPTVLGVPQNYHAGGTGIWWSECDTQVVLATSDVAQHGTLVFDNVTHDLGAGNTNQGSTGIVPETSVGVWIKGNIAYNIYAASNTGGTKANFYASGSAGDGEAFDTGSGGTDILLEKNLGFNCAIGCLIDGPYLQTDTNEKIWVRNNVFIPYSWGIYNYLPGGTRYYSAALGQFAYIYNNTIICPSAYATASVATPILAAGTGFYLLNNILICHGNLAIGYSSNNGHGVNTRPVIMGNYYVAPTLSYDFAGVDGGTTTLAGMRALGFETLGGTNYGSIGTYQSAGEAFYIGSSANSYDQDVASKFEGYPQSYIDLPLFTAMQPVAGSLPYGAGFLNIKSNFSISTPPTDFLGNPYNPSIAGAYNSLLSNYSPPGTTMVTIITSTPVGTNGIIFGLANANILPATGNIDDINTVFTFTQMPTIVNINGSAYTSTSTINGILAWQVFT